MESSSTPVGNTARLVHPDWSRDAALYQINTRHFTDEGTFRAAQEHLPRLKELGVSILWLMPVHEIGQVNRKGGTGSLGSPYAVKDYYTVSPELGTVEDLRSFVDAAHALDLYVILDWVANHTAWDSVLVAEHPEWYARDWKGDFTPTPWWDWDDIIDLDYTNSDLRDYMCAAMRYWVAEVGVDGYRCDVAGFVPTDFWERVRAELDTIKPVFMLAEWESKDLHAAAFDASYAWSWNYDLHRIAQGQLTVDSLRVYYSWNERFFPRDAMRMTFVSNHDKNAWEGTEFEQFGDAVHASVVLSVIGEGLPLIYSGQEAGNDRRLKFFEKDAITWTEHPMGELYRDLFALKRETSALWNAAWGARMIQVTTDQLIEVLAFVRQDENGGVFALFNFSGEPREVTLTGGPCAGEWQAWTGGNEATGAQVAHTLDADVGTKLQLPAWGWRVYLRA